MKKLSSMIGMVAAGLVLSQCVSASAGFRCGFNKIVNIGDNTGKVRAICGTPVSRDVVSGGGSEVQKEAWTYRDHDDRKWMTTLHFTDGRLTRIESLGKVD